MPLETPVPHRRRLEIAAPETRIEVPYSGFPIDPSEGENASRKQPAAPPALADCATGGLTEAQIHEYRSRLNRGFYASPAVIREVARRILESRAL
jgi:hypothetical protein